MFLPAAPRLLITCFALTYTVLSTANTLSATPSPAPPLTPSYQTLAKVSPTLLKKQASKKSLLTEQIHFPNTSITLTAGSRRILSQNCSIWLHEPIRVTNGLWMASSTDIDTIVHPIISRTAKFGTNKISVVLDAGHGGEDGGAPSPAGFIYEKDLTLKIALQVRDFLEGSNIDLVLTRETDKTLTLAQRCNMITTNSSLFVSIHVNSARSEKARGFETFSIPHTGFSSTMGSTYPTTNVIGNLNTAQSNLAAFFVQNQLMQTKLSIDRGVRHSRFFVLRNASCPAILIECGFITNLSDARMLCNDESLKTISQSIAFAIQRFANTTSCINQCDPSQ